jgi:hypothetical protein
VPAAYYSVVLRCDGTEGESTGLSLLPARRNATVPPRSRFLPIPLKQFFPSDLLRIIAFLYFDPSALLPIFPKQVLPATRKLLMSAIFPITLEKLGRQKINSPPGTSLKAAQDASSSHIAHPVLTSVTVYWLFSRPGLISAAGLTVILAGGL